MTVVLDLRVIKGSGGGPDKTIINSPRYLAEQGYEMLCAYLHHPEDEGFPKLKEKARAKGVDLISIPDHGPLDYQVVSKILKLCKERNVSIWHGHDYKTNLLGLMIYPFWPMRLVTTVHGWVEQTNRTPIYYMIDRCTLRFYEKVFCVSDDLFHTCRQAGVPRSRCLLLKNGIDLDEFRRRKSIAQAKAESGIPQDRLLIGAAGRLSSEKGFDLLIDSLKSLLDNHLPLSLMIFGEGKEQQALQHKIDATGYSDHIQLMGFQSDLRPYYEAMDAFVLSSLREGLPNVVLEAMAMEVPVLATRIAGIPKLIEHEVNGYIVEPGSVSELENGLRLLMQDEVRRQRYSRNGRVTVETNCSFSKRMSMLAEVYDSMQADSSRLAGACL